MERERRVNTPESSRQYLEAILSIQNLSRLYTLDHRFVGGTFTDLLNPKTQAVFDFDKRYVFLKDYTPPQMFRTDQTVKDMDLISFQEDPSRFNDGREGFKEKEQGVKKQKLPFPHVSIEPIRTPANPRNPILQFVSGFETDGEDLFLTFDHIRQKIDPKTIEPWRVVLTNDFGVSFTTLNPFAHALRYSMRVPFGIKQKDRELKRENGLTYNKMSPYVRLALQYAEEAEAQGINMSGLYGPWMEFIAKMRHDKRLRIQTKRLGTEFYWNSIGTALAHGRGVLGPIAKLGDRFTG